MDAWSAVRKPAPIYEGRGNRTAALALKDSICEIGASSEPLRDEEIDAIVRGTGEKPLAIPVATEALAIVASPDFHLDSIKREQLVNNFSEGAQDGTSAGFKADVKIHAFGVNSASDRYFWFKKFLDKSISDRVLETSGPLSLVDKIAKTKGGIGYARPREILNAKTLAIATDGRLFVPDRSSIASGSYPLTRYYYFYTIHPSTETKEFIKFVLSDEGQARLDPLGLFAVRADVRDKSRKELESFR